MARGQLSSVVRHLHRLAAAAQCAEPSDPDLLRRFAGGREEDAFAALVRRHGPMVLGVCRRVLHNRHDAEDAFQATFLILARKADSIRNADSLASWLHGVALRTALRARAKGAARRRHERQVPDMPHQDAFAAVVWRDLQPILDEEVQRLPETLRAPFVLCYLEGKTYEQAAEQLKCQTGTVSRRLAQARERLRARLARRGLVLPAGLLAVALSEQAAPAAMPAPLATSTVKAALACAAGAAAGVSTQVAALVEGGLETMAATKARIATALILAVGLLGTALGVLARHALADRPSEQPRPHTPTAALASDAVAADPAAGQGETLVSGRVLGADGKPVPGAHVAVIAFAYHLYRSERQVEQATALAHGRADAKGSYHLTIPRFVEGQYMDVSVVAGAEGHALGRQPVGPGRDKVTADVTLGKEQVLRGRMLDLQGQPAAGVKVWLRRVTTYDNSKAMFSVHFPHPLGKLSDWPTAAVTDAQGRFSLRAIGAGWSGSLQTEDDRFGSPELWLAARQLDGKELSFSLAPARTLEGTVAYADTKQPAAGAEVVVRSLGQSNFTLTAKTDGQGKYRIVAPPSPAYTVLAYLPSAGPYLLHWKEVKWPKADVLKQQVDLSFPRGVLVRGVVKESASGKPVAGATAHFMPRYSNNPFYRRDVIPMFRGDAQLGITGADGKFELAVLPGPGHLLINGPTNDYVHAEILSKDLVGEGVLPNRRHYPDGLVALDLKPDAGTHDVTVTLRRGETVKGKLADPDGTLVAQVKMVARSHVPSGFELHVVHPVEVKGGRFELPGCDPEKAQPVFFLDAKSQLGAVVELSGKDAAKADLTVRLKPCGTAKVRFVDDEGKPLADMSPRVEMVVTPGLSFFESLDGKDVTGDDADMRALDRDRYRDLRTDADGRVTLPSLIPGATYRLIGRNRNGNFRSARTEFTVEPGQTLDLKDVTLKTAPR